MQQQPVISLIIGLVSYAHWGERTKSGRWARGASTACWVGVSGLMFSIAISGGGIGGRKRSVSFGGWQEESSNLVGRANWSSGRFDLIKGGLETASGLPTLAWAIGILALLNL
ncbi:hypothetical protein B0T17DRAFT_517312 [Bombardia bombarda]|uniref:Uncharacterized protein n=1 Tax=Bombardia bombarda TaxID=252184 RepID=A0AA40CET1_9PEZI|nr:hypothetical protein B0T17DRAFT_517312 [Bombardia bombarda]